MPADGAVVSVLATSVQVRTGASGRFRIVSLPAGEYRVLIRKPGYDPITSTVDGRPGDTTRVTYLLYATTVVLDTAFVRASRQPNRLSGFEERRQQWMG